MSKKIGSRISITISPEQRARLEQRAIETGVPQSEQIRRAINLAIFADQQVVRNSARSIQPVLITKAGE